MQTTFVPTVVTFRKTKRTSLANAHSSISFHGRRSSSRRPRMSSTDGAAESGIPRAMSDWREMRAKLRVGSEAAFEQQKQSAYRPGHWAHPISVPETGCFLASHPALFRRGAPYLTQSVVFLISYSSSRGAVGLVLNRPLRGTLSNLNMIGALSLPRSIREALGSQPVYLGGSDAYEGSALLILHSDERVATGDRAAIEPLPGVYVGPVDMVLSGRTIAVPPPGAELRLFAGCLRWPPGKLEAEVDTGEWFCVSASKKFATSHCLQLPKPLWVEIMESQGEPFSKIVRQIYGDDE